MIRPATEQDCANLAALSLQVWLETYALEGIKTKYAEYALDTFSKGQFQGLLAQPRYQILVYYRDDVLCGYALVDLESRYQDKTNGFELARLYVHNKFSGQGIGKQLMQAVARRFGTPYWLYTWVENKSNRFYQHLGCKKIGELSFDFAGVAIKNNIYCYRSS